jgi:hypothetical protein
MPATRSFKFMGTGAMTCFRAKASNWPTSSAERWPASVISCKGVKRGSAGSSVASACSALPRMTVNMLLKSCATPPASRPTDSSFCACLS